MRTLGTLTVELSSDVARIVRDAVAAGDYPDARAAVEAALQSWVTQRDGQILGYSPEELRRLGDEGEASGPAAEVGIEEIKREGFRAAGIPYPAG